MQKIILISIVLFLAGCSMHEMESMEMHALDQLPMEEPQSTLQPKIVFEGGKEIKVFNLSIEAIKKEIRPGVHVEAWGFNRQVPGPEIRVQEGDQVRVYFTNKHVEEHTIHWHGQHVPTNMDGVPGISQRPVKTNETFVYEFVASPSGTHMYHCHVDADHHLDMGMYGAFIVEPKKEEQYDKEFTWILSSFATKKHDHVSKKSDYFSGHAQYKVEKDAFLINGKAFPATDVLTVEEHDLVKMRLIHAGKEPYSMHLHGHSFKVTHKDGFAIRNPQTMDTLPMLPGERYDIEIKMNNKGAWVFHDHITPHATNDGFYPGGMLALITYDGFVLPESMKALLSEIGYYTDLVQREGMLPEASMHNEHNMG